MNDTLNKILKWIGIILGCAMILIPLYIAVVLFGNPVSAILTHNGSQQYLEEHFADTDFQISKTGYNFKTGSYYAFIASPSSQDSYFTVSFDGWGRYRYDTYENVINRTTTLSRLDTQYHELVDSGLSEEGTPFDISIVFGELKVAGTQEIFSYTDTNGDTKTYTIEKDYGLDRSNLELDREYDILALGHEAGRIVLYIHDEEVTTERAAALLLEVKAYLDLQGIPFHAINFNLCAPRNEQGQLIGEQITLFDFLYEDIYEEDLHLRVEQHWLAAQEHFAIQDRLKTMEDPLYVK